MITRYVNTASTAGGDGTTNATIGDHRAFATMDQAESTLRNKQFNSDLLLLCCGSVEDEYRVDWDPDYNYFDGPGYTLTIQANRSEPDGFHGGHWNDSTYRLNVNDSNLAMPLNGSDTKPIRIVFDGLQVTMTNNRFVLFQWTGNWIDGCEVKNCIFRMAMDGGDEYFISGSPSGGKWYFHDNVVQSYGGSGGLVQSVYLNSTNDTPVYFYNNLITRGWRGISVYQSNVTIKNCTVFGFGEDIRVAVGQTNVVVDRCASDDGYGTNPISVSDWGDEFLNPNYLEDGDFRLKPGSVLIKAGVGPASDSNVPVDGMRSAYRHGLVCDAGPFQYSFHKAKTGFPGANTQSGLV